MPAVERESVPRSLLDEDRAEDEPLRGAANALALWERVVSHISCLGPLPCGILAVHRAAADPEATATDLAETLGADQALAGAVLRLANCAFFALPRRVSSLVDAVVLLGFEQVRTLAYTVWTGNLLRVLPRIGGVSPALLWRHSLATAISAKQLAMAGLFVDPDTAFTAGVLHDIGSVVVRACAPRESLDCLIAARARDIPLHEAERELLGTAHTEVGGFLLSRWQLPPPLVESAGRHHEPADDTPWAELVAIVHVADCVAVEAGYQPDYLPPRPPAPKALQLLALEPKHLDVQRQALLAAVEKAKELFRILSA
jgi:HD-like signal output (HDOD) protein